MLLIETYVAASAVEGVGVFAAVPVEAGAQIWRLEPGFDRLIPTAEYEAANPVLKGLLDRYAYPSPEDPSVIVYEVDNGRFMNHSEDPNTDFSKFGGGYALRAIEAGEELTCNYGDFFKDFELIPNPASRIEGAQATTA